MASKAEVARIAEGHRREAERLERASARRDGAQAEYDALVEAQRQLVEGQVATLKELEASAASAQAAHDLAADAHAETGRALEGKRADIEAIVARRRGVTALHIDDVRELGNRIAALAPKLTVDAWLEAAE